jgi:hypothetical protein
MPGLPKGFGSTALAPQQEQGVASAWCIGSVSVVYQTLGEG